MSEPQLHPHLPLKVLTVPPRAKGQAVTTGTIAELQRKLPNGICLPPRDFSELGKSLDLKDLNGFCFL